MRGKRTVPVPISSLRKIARMWEKYHGMSFEGWPSPAGKFNITPQEAEFLLDDVGKFLTSALTTFLYQSYRAGKIERESYADLEWVNQIEVFVASFKHKVCCFEQVVKAHPRSRLLQNAWKYLKPVDFPRRSRRSVSGD